MKSFLCQYCDAPLLERTGYWEGKKIQYFHCHIWHEIRRDDSHLYIVPITDEEVLKK